ncbi:MAG: hypothetical protein ACI4C4_12670 [Lachnospiraceae bacterium]
MKRKIVLALIVMSTVGVFGCGNKQVDVTEEETEEILDTEELLQNTDDPEDMSGVEQADYIPNSFVEEFAGKNTFESYDEVIGFLQPGQAYAYIEMYGYDGKVLLVTENTFVDGDGKTVAMQAGAYALIEDEVWYVTAASSDGTARPLAVKDGILMEAEQHGVSGYFFVPEGDAVMAKFSVYESFDAEGNVEYGGFVRQTNSFDESDETWISTEEEYQNCYEEYLSATPIEFTVV